MITRITVDNFMSHVHTVIEPCGSLTVLVGPNNCGKSAFLSAIQVLARDVDGDFMVRHGAKEARILLETDEGHSVQWRRKGAVVTYSIDGEDVHRNTPDGLAEIVRMPIVPGPGKSPEKFDVHFGDQKQPLFLLDKPGSNSATFFASASDADYLVRMQSLHKLHTKDTKSNYTRLTNEVRSLEARIEAQAPAEAVSERLRQQELAYEAVSSAQLNVEKLEEDIRRLTAAIDSEGRARREYQPLAKGIPVPPETLDTPVLNEVVSKLATAERNSDAARRMLEATSKIPEPPELLDLSGITAAGRDIKRSKEEVGHCVTNLKSATDAIAQFKAKLEDWAVQNPTCPTCGQLLRTEVILDRLEMGLA